MKVALLWVIIVLLICGALALEVNVEAPSNKKMKYAYYLAKVKGFFNETANIGPKP